MGRTSKRPVVPQAHTALISPELDDGRPADLFHQLMTMVNRPSLKDQTPKHLQAQITSTIDHMKLVLDGLAEDLKQGAIDVERASTLVEGVKTDIGPCQQGLDESRQAISKLHEIDAAVKTKLKRRNRDLRVTMDQLKRLSGAYVKSRQRRCFEEPDDTTAPETLARLLDTIAPAKENPHQSDHRHKLLARVRKSALEKMDEKLPWQTLQKNWQEKVGPSIFNLLPHMPFSRARKDFDRLNDHYEAIEQCAQKCEKD